MTSSPTLRGTQLHAFSPSSLEALDRVRYWLNFDRLRVIVHGDAPWKLVYLSEHSPTLVLDEPCFVLDAARFQSWLRLVDVDARGRVRKRPTFDEGRAAVDAMPLSPAVTTTAPSTPAATQPDSARTHTDLPCHGCAAPCCDHIVVPYTRPSGRQALDAVSNLLETPGLAIGLATDGAWALTATTRCRHFDAAQRRCTVYGKPERPGFCRTYSGWGCEFRKLFAAKPSGHFLPLDALQFKVVRELIPLSRGGSALGWPSARECVELLTERGLS